MKEAVFHLALLADLRSFPIEIRKELGKLILDLQFGAQLSLPVSRPIPSVGKGVSELRVKDRFIK
jgi:phage-related protein